ncbi:unnamed protein product, partial [Ixodes pacificus]
TSPLPNQCQAPHSSSLIRQLISVDPRGHAFIQTSRNAEHLVKECFTLKKVIYTGICEVLAAGLGTEPVFLAQVLIFCGVLKIHGKHNHHTAKNQVLCPLLSYKGRQPNKNLKLRT